MKFQVNKYETPETFELAINAKYKDGWTLSSWKIDRDWGIVAVFIRQRRRYGLQN